ncbi:MAG: hypothetical protein JRN35_05610 [Nitrososphaerota archaeon]|nr:hypothetical protein [Nitrososphaerota archaeon]
MDAAVPSAGFSMVSERKPSSMGLSVLIGKKSRKLQVHVEWATYSRIGGNQAGEELWQRRERSERINVPLPLTARYTHPLNSEKDDGPIPEITVIPSPRQGENQTLSVFLSNQQTSPEERESSNLRSMFSPRIRLTLDGEGFPARAAENQLMSEDDLASLRLLYRERHEFATGHGCSVRWDRVHGSTCLEIETTFVPQYRQPKLAFRQTTGGMCMGNFAEPVELPKTLSTLSKLVEEYEGWIASTFSPQERTKFKGELLEAFLRHRSECYLALGRMKNGLKALRENKLVQQSFFFMNQAMYLQRLHAEEAERVQREGGHSYVEPKPKDSSSKTSVAWRSFQMAFILETIPDIVDGASPHREEVDLLWVGTGGGKTEAYLGIAAFSLAFRRLSRGPDVLQSGGMNVLMRYTLRLLTIQQFQRAATLLCACEVIRDSDTRRWGNASHPFLVGLLVGQNTTPNWTGSESDLRDSALSESEEDSEQRTAIQALSLYQRTHEVPQGSNPFQLSHCPWCGARLTEVSYSIDRNLGLRTHCVRQGCYFQTHDIPVLTVDEDILHRLPALVIGTVDKFAQLPFNPNLAALFGHVRARCRDHGFIGRTENHPSQHRGAPPVQELSAPLPPPDIVIQDELHLLNGPLGSLVGIYETAIDFLCSRAEPNGRRLPKIVTSTATIRRANDQVNSIFARSVHRFPPPGSLVNDSFFLKEDIDMSADKLYVGVIPSGIGQKTLLKKALSAVLLKVQEARDNGRPVDDWDRFWTVVAYFNSIRELGSAKTTIEDDINNEVADKRQILPVPELTSNLDSSQLPQMLDDLFRKGDDPRAVGILACSNMFSVGVDVTRLGLMVVNSQPKTTAEYVQATGRVGRAKTGNGLVIILYNWARPRDQSHFERFYDYHQRIQSHVEAITVTPFSDGSRHRALHAVYVGLARAVGSGSLAGNRDAVHYTTLVRGSAAYQEMEKWVLDRASTVSPDSSADTRGDLEDFLDEWVGSTQFEGGLHYTGGYYSRRTKNIVLAKTPEEADIRDAGPRRLTPNSLRNVEKEVRIRKDTRR